MPPAEPQPTPPTPPLQPPQPITPVVPEHMSFAFPLSIISLIPLLGLPIAIYALISGLKDKKLGKPKAQVAVLISIIALLISGVVITMALTSKDKPAQAVATSCYKFTIPPIKLAATVKNDGDCDIAISQGDGIFADFQINTFADKGALQSATSSQIDQKLKAASDALLTQAKSKGLELGTPTQDYSSIDGARTYQLTATAKGPLADFGKLVGWDIIYAPKAYPISSGSSQVFSWYFEGRDNDTKNLQSVIDSWKWQ